MILLIICQILIKFFFNIYFQNNFSKMRDNPFKSKVSLLEPNYPFRASRSSNPKQKQQFRNPFQRKFLIPETKNYSHKKETKSKSLYFEKLSQRSPFSQIQTKSHHLFNPKDYHQYQSIFVAEEGFRRQKTLELQRKYSQIFGYQALRYQYDGNKINKQYFDKKIQSNKSEGTSKTNKLFKQSCQAYANKGIKQNQSRNLKEQKKTKKSKEKRKIKKMLSWNIQNEKELEEKRKISHKQFLLKQSNQSSFLGVLSKNLEENPIQKKKMALNEGPTQDYVLQVSKNERLSSKMSSSSLFSRQNFNFNNLNYGSNFQWLSFQKPKQFNEAQEKKKVDNFPEQISFEGKKFDLLRF